MLPGYGRVVAGNSGKPQLENGDGRRPFSGHGGAGGCSDPRGANTWRCQTACCWLSALVSVGIRIGLAPADAAVAARTGMAAARAIPNSRRFILSLPLVWAYPADGLL